MSAPDAETMERLAAKVIVEGLSVRAIEELIFRVEHPAEKQKKERAMDPNVRQAERDMQASLGMKVRIMDRKGRGKIVIEYGSLDDFDRLVTALAGK
jgi:ParB family transcriptional regulator, chromosome partitioning protein